MEKRPFTRNSIKEHANKGGTMSPSSGPRMIASPMLNSKFSPSNAIGKSPVMTKKSVFNQIESKKNPSPFLNQFARKDNKTEKKETTTTEEKEEEKSKVNVNRKARNMFKDIEHIEKNPKFMEKNKDDDLPLTSGIKAGKKDEIDLKIEQGAEINYEGYLTKFSSSNSVLKRWFKLIGKDFYCNFNNNYLDYKTNGDKEHSGMHNLSGVFVKDEPPETVGGIKYYPFSVLYPNKKRSYYCENEEETKIWVKCIRGVTGYLNLNDIYDVKVNNVLKFSKNLETENSVSLNWAFIKKQEEK